MQTEIIETGSSQELGSYIVLPEEKAGIFDLVFGSYIIAMLATNYSAYNDLLSNIGMGIPVLFLFTLFFARYHFQREFFILVALYLWILLGCVLSDYRQISWISTFYIMKAQFVMVVVALRCNTLKRVRFYLVMVAIATACLTVPSLFTAKYMALDERLRGTVGQANALGARSALSFISCICLLFMVKGRWKWIVFPGIIIISLRVVMLTGSRGAAVTAMCFAAACSWYFWRRSRLATKVLFPVAVAVIGTVVLIVAGELPIVRRLAALPLVLGIETGIGATGQDTDIARLLILKEALVVFRQYPILGAGYGTFRAYSYYIYTHTTPFEFLYATGVVGTFLYYFVIVSSWLVLSKAKKLSEHIPEIGRYVDVGRILIIAELAAGLSVPTHLSKAQSIVSGVWLGIVWYMRSWTKQKLEYESSIRSDLAELNTF